MSRNLLQFVTWNLIGMLIVGCGQSIEGRDLPIDDLKRQKKSRANDEYSNSRVKKGNISDRRLEDLDESDLPSYLIRSEDMDEYEPIVLEFKAMPSVGGQVVEAPGSRPIEAFIADFLINALKSPALSPGRPIRVTISSATQTNATMYGNGQMVINSASIQKLDAESTLALICHELAHSARNHSYEKVEEGRKFSSNSSLITEINAYLQSQISNGTYVHDKARYEKIRKKWDVESQDLSDFNKKTESEADVVGAKICGVMGMKKNVYIKSTQAIFDRAEKDSIEIKGSSNPMDLADRARLQIFTNNYNAFFNMYLFPISTHPTINERINQLERLERFLDMNQDDVEDQHFENWLNKFPSERDRFKSISNLNLTSDDVSHDHTHLANGLDGGFKIPISVRSCSHGEQFILREGQ